MLIDTHAHFDHLFGDSERRAALERAKRAGVHRVIAVGGNPKANTCVVELARARSDQVMAAVGYDREMACRDTPVDTLKEAVKDSNVVAIGEIGLDYHYARETRAAQRVLFDRMLALAAEAGKPVIVHSRDAEEDTLAMIKNWCGGDPARIGVLHCFTGSAGFSTKLVEMGFFIGLSGIITFRQAKSLRELAKELPLDRILIETDSPYLAPVPVRGTVNEPANLRYIAECLAQIRHDTVEHIAHSTSENAIRLFKLHGGQRL